MPALKLFTDVQARVVAWHNRHPLARQIQASQVHSIGEVALPFAAKTGPAAPTGGTAPAALPHSTELLSEASPAMHGLDTPTSAGAGPDLDPDLDHHQADTADAAPGAPEVPASDATGQARPPNPTGSDSAAAHASAAAEDAEQDPWPDGPGARAPTSGTLTADQDSPVAAPDAPFASDTGSTAAEGGGAGGPGEPAAPEAPGAADAPTADDDLDALLDAVADPAGATTADAAPANPGDETKGSSINGKGNDGTDGADGAASDDDLPEFVIDPPDSPTQDDPAETDASDAPAPEAAAQTAPQDEPRDTAESEPLSGVPPDDAAATAEAPSPAAPEADTGLVAATATDTDPATDTAADPENKPDAAEPGPAPAHALAELPSPTTGLDLNAQAMAEAEAEANAQAEAAADADAANAAAGLSGDAIALPEGSGGTPDAAQAPPTLADRLQAARTAASSGDAEASADAQATALAAAPAAASSPAPASPALAATPAALPSLALPSLPWWRRWLARWRAKARGQAGAANAGADAPATGVATDPAALHQPLLGPLTALFTGKFLWPVSPQRVARWARRHGSLLALAPPDWPVRHVAPEPDLLQKARKAGRPTTTTVHLFTAAIGVDDRRMRVLVSADGQVLGPRAYDRKRVAAASLALALAMGGLGWGLKPAALPGLPSAEEATELAAAASAPPLTDHTEAPEAAQVHDPAASGTSPYDHPTSLAMAGSASAPDDPDDIGDHATAMPGRPHAQTPGLQRTAIDAPHTGAAHTGPSDNSGFNNTAGATGILPADPAPLAAAKELTPPATRQPGELVITRTPPPAFPQRRASGPVAQIRPQLPEDVRLAARAQSEAARNAADKNLPMPVDLPTQRYAVVSQPERDRETAESRLATMLSVRAQLPPPAPLHSDVMPTQGRWRVALWPFANQADAERAREMLQVRGLRAEVVAF